MVVRQQGRPVEPADLGACCACGTTDPTRMIRNLLMLHHPAPAPGTGWGCFQCGLPADGALAVVCDACLKSKRTLREVIAGYRHEGRRVPFARLGAAVFTHDMSKHPGESEAGQ